MRLVAITSILLAAVLTACGSVHDRAACGASTDCPAGQYCARTSDGNVCWADAVPPVVSAVTVTCDPVVVGSTCLRDGVLHVRATITDDKEVLGADVHLDVGGAPVPLARVAGNVWGADVQLARVPFGFFDHAVVATVTARDGARNTASLEPAGATTVTRHLWQTPLGAGLASPAVSSTGVLAVSANNGRVHLLSWDGSYVGSVELAIGTPQLVTAPTSIGDSFWVGADDGHVYELLSSGGIWGAISRASTGGPVRGSVASTSTGTVIAAAYDSGGSGGVVFAVTQTTAKNGPPVGLPIGVGPVVDATDGIYAVAVGSVRRYSLNGGFPTDAWGGVTSVDGTVSSPLACTSVLVATANTLSAGIVRSVDASGDPQHIATTAFSSGGAAVLSDGSIVVPEQTRTLSRWTAAGAAYPGWQKPDLGGATNTPLVVTSLTPLIVPTAKGALYALRADGTIAWSGQLSAGTASLQPGNIYTRPGQTPGQELSTAYFAGSDGVLHAVIVDGALDASAPWPKAFHDPRNTNRAGAQP
jgi:hypothetical protein